ncbi:MAG: DUF4340 domain-containing protein [Clostridia bacterium]|nr:DUF4340 domain-containing protein [Clostridia bacterium]
MEQKDKTTGEAPLKKLATAQELRGSKSGSGKEGKGGKRKLWLSAIALVVVLAAAIGIYVASNLIKPEEEVVEDNTPTYTSETVKLIEHSRSEVASVVIDLPDGEAYTILNNNKYDEDGNRIALEAGEKAYAIEGIEDFDLDQSKAETIIGYGANLTATKMITDNAENLADYGLDNPRSTVTINYKSGVSSTWLIGSQAPTSSASYFAEKGGKGVFLIYSSAVSNLTSPRNSLHTVAMPWTIADATSITDVLIEAEGKDTIELGYIESDETNLSISTLRLLQPFVYGAHMDRSDEMFQGVMGLTISGYAGELDELENTGLEDGGAVVKVTATVQLDEDNSTQYVYRLGGFASSDQRYVQIDDTNAVYLTDTSNVAFLDNATPGYLVDLFSNLVFIDRVESIDIATPSDSWNISIEREEVEGKTKPQDYFFFDGEPADESLTRKLYQVIIGTMNSKLSDDYHIDGDVYCTVKYNLNVDPGQMVVEYVEYNDEYLAVRRDDLTLFLIKRENVDAMITALNQFREGTYNPS